MSEKKWACDDGKFWGTIRQLLNCAKCGRLIDGGHHTPRHIADMFKPSMHVLCDECFDDLPE